MSLVWREGQAEADRKERIFAARAREEAELRRELHYHQLITENVKLKDALRLAKSDIEDWVYSKGDSPQSTEVIALIDTLLK